MLRASSSRAAAPASPTRQRARPTSSTGAAWSPSQPIRFAPAPAAAVSAPQKPTAAPLKTWQPGQPILFDEGGAARQPKGPRPSEMHKKGKEKQGSAAEIRSVPSARPSASVADTTRATTSSSPGRSLANTTSSSLASWTSNRWDPPSPTDTLASYDVSTSTVRFSPSRSYAQIGQLARPSSPFAHRGTALMDSSADSADLSVEFGSFSGAVDAWGNRKVSIGVQAGTPLAQRRRREMSVVSPTSAVLAQPTMSQAQVDDLLDGIDFDDDIEMSLEDEASVESVESFKSAMASPPAPTKSTTPGSAKVSLRSRSIRSPSPLSDNSTVDLFSPAPVASTSTHRRTSSPILASSFYVPTPSTASARTFSTTSRRAQLTAQEIQEALDDEFEEEDDEIEIIAPIQALSASKGKGKEQPVKLDSDAYDSDEDEVEIVPRVPNPAPLPPVSKPAPLKPTSSSSGWFVKPPSLASATPAVPAAPVEKSKYVPNPPHTSARAKNLARKVKKAEEDSILREKYPRDFNWQRWGARRARLVYTFDEEEVARELAAMKGPVGFDLEWEPSKRRGMENVTALAQVASEDTILLIHIARMKRFPPALQAFIEDADRIKLGVQIGGDARKLQRDFLGFQPRGLLELNNMARQIDPARFVARTKPGLAGLQELVGTYLDHYLGKETAVRCGKWSQELGDDQRFYAANDVFSSLHVFLALRELAEDDAYLKHVSNNSSSASSWRPLGQQVRHHSTHVLPTRSPSPTVDSNGRKSAPTARQRETYESWQKDGLAVEAVAIRMGIKPLSVVWNLLACLSTVDGSSMEFDRQRLLDALDEVGGGVPKMLQENAPLLERVRGELGIVD